MIRLGVALVPAISSLSASAQDIDLVNATLSDGRTLFEPRPVVSDGRKLVEGLGPQACARSAAAADRVPGKRGERIAIGRGGHVR